MSTILKTGDIVAIDHSIKDPHELDKKMVAFLKKGGIAIEWLKVLEDGIVVGVPENKDDFDSVVHLKGKEIEHRYCRQNFLVVGKKKLIF